MVGLYKDIPAGRSTVAIHVNYVVAPLAGEDFALNAPS